jgi:MFS family permease
MSGGEALAGTPATPPPGGPAPGLASTGFRSLLGSTTVSSLGGSISSVAVAWLVYHETGSTLDVAYVGLTGIVPGIVFGLLAGVLADRYNRRRLMLTADTVRCVAMAALALTLYAVGFSLLTVLAVMTVVYTFSALFTPASNAILPRLVATEHLEDANGVLTASAQTAQTIGAGVGGLVVVAAGPALGLGINALTFLLSALFLVQIASGLGRPRANAKEHPTSMRDELGEGFHYMREHPTVLQVTFGFLPGNFLFTMVLGFVVVYASTVLGHSAAIYGYLEAAFAGSAAVGALLVGRLRARRFAGLLMGSCVVAQGGGIGLLVVAHDLPIALVGMAILGLNLGLINTVFFATMQAIIPNEVLARVLSIDQVGSFVAIPAGLLVGGVLAGSHGILFTFSIAAVGSFLTGLVLLALPGVRGLRYTAGPKPPPDAPAPGGG